MKRTLPHLKVLINTIAAALLGTIILAAAEAPKGGAAERPAGDRGAAEGRGRGGIGLDDQQRQLLREAMQKDREAMSRLTEQLRVAQKELMQAALAEKLDEKVVRAKAEAVAKIQVDLTLIRAKALSTVAPTLKPEQREQLENSPVGGMLLSTGGMDFGGRIDRGGDANRPRGDRGTGTAPR